MQPMVKPLLRIVHRFNFRFHTHCWGNWSKCKVSCNFRFLVCFEPFYEHRSGNGWSCCHFLHIIIIVKQHHLLIGQMVLQTLNNRKLLMHIKLEYAPRCFRCRYIATVEIFFNFIRFDHIPFGGIVVLAWDLNSCMIMSFIYVLK